MTTPHVDNEIIKFMLMTGGATMMTNDTESERVNPLIYNSEPAIDRGLSVFQSLMSRLSMGNSRWTMNNIWVQQSNCLNFISNNSNLFHYLYLCRNNDLSNQVNSSCKTQTMWQRPVRKSRAASSVLRNVPYRKHSNARP